MMQASCLTVCQGPMGCKSLMACSALEMLDMHADLVFYLPSGKQGATSTGLVQGTNLMQKELFNLRHSSLGVTIERAFAALKNRFKVLDQKPFHTFDTQVKLVLACCILHN